MGMRPFNFLNFVLLAVLALAAISCKTEQVFQARGIVQEVLPDQKQVKIDHEKIPNYMEAMTMTFDVKDPKELAGLQPGDQVILSDTSAWDAHERIALK